MRRLLLSGFFFGILTSVTYSQNSSYQIVKIGNQYTMDLIQETMSKANLCGMINPTESYLIVFDDGSEVKINAASDVQSELNPECIREVNLHEDGIAWSIKGNAILIKAVTSNNIKKS